MEKGNSKLQVEKKFSSLVISRLQNLPFKKKFKTGILPEINCFVFSILCLNF